MNYFDVDWLSPGPAATIAMWILIAVIAIIDHVLTERKFNRR